MRSTQQFSITLPNEMADAVRAKVASGEYATESEVIRDGLRALLARDQAIERWLRDEVTAAYDALSPAMQAFVSGLVVRHDNTSFIRGMIAKVAHLVAVEKLEV